MEGNLKKNMCVCVYVLLLLLLLSRFSRVRLCATPETAVYTHIQTDTYAAESLCSSPEADTTLWVNHTSGFF